MVCMMYGKMASYVKFFSKSQTPQMEYFGEDFSNHVRDEILDFFVRI